jgi:hypothetical protein
LKTVFHFKNLHLNLNQGSCHLKELLLGHLGLLPGNSGKKIEIGTPKKIEVVISNRESDNVEIEIEITEHVINFPKLDHEHLKPVFGDTENLISKDKTLPKCGGIFRRFKEENFPDIVPLSDPSRRNFDDLVY